MALYSTVAVSGFYFYFEHIYRRNYPFNFSYYSMYLHIKIQTTCAVITKCTCMYSLNVLNTQRFFSFAA